MKEWPEDKTETLPYSYLIEHVRKAVNFAYDLERKNKGKDIPYEGYGHTELAGTPNSDEMLGKEHLEYQKERDRDAMDCILNVAFLLGMEQGKRRRNKSLHHQKKMCNSNKSLFFHHICKLLKQGDFPDEDELREQAIEMWADFGADWNDEAPKSMKEVGERKEKRREEAREILKNS